MKRITEFFLLEPEDKKRVLVDVDFVIKTEEEVFVFEHGGSVNDTYHKLKKITPAQKQAIQNIEQGKKVFTGSCPFCGEIWDTLIEHRQEDNCPKCGKRNDDYYIYKSIK